MAELLDVQETAAFAADQGRALSEMTPAEKIRARAHAAQNVRATVFEPLRRHGGGSAEDIADEASEDVTMAAEAADAVGDAATEKVGASEKPRKVVRMDGFVLICGERVPRGQVQYLKNLRQQYLAESEEGREHMMTVLSRESGHRQGFWEKFLKEETA